jgi:hypothetical protein
MGQVADQGGQGAVWVTQMARKFETLPKAQTFKLGL